MQKIIWHTDLSAECQVYQNKKISQSQALTEWIIELVYVQCKFFIKKKIGDDTLKPWLFCFEERKHKEFCDCRT